MNYIAPIKFYFAIVNRCKVQQKSFFAKNDQTGKGTSFPVAYTLTVGLASFPVHIFRLMPQDMCAVRGAYTPRQTKLLIHKLHFI